MKKILLFISIIIAISGCSASETKWDYKGYIIDIIEEENVKIYQVMWGISEEDLKTKTAGDLNEYNSDKFVLVQIDQNNSDQNGFKVGDKVLVQVEKEIQYPIVKPKKIELDTSSEQ